VIALKKSNRIFAVSCTIFKPVIHRFVLTLLGATALTELDGPRPDPLRNNHGLRYFPGRYFGVIALEAAQGVGGSSPKALGITNGFLPRPPFAPAAA
jgi:hypothetical protein